MANRRISPEVRAAILEALANNATYREIAAKWRISQPTIARIKREGTNPPEPTQHEPRSPPQPNAAQAPQETHEQEGQGETFTLREETPPQRKPKPNPTPDEPAKPRSRIFVL